MARRPLWTRATAAAYVATLAGELAAAGFRPVIVGGVATRGASDNDLDLVLEPLRVFAGVEEAEWAFLDHVGPRLADDVIMLDFIPNQFHEPGSMLRVWSDATHVVEFYLPYELYPGPR